MVELPCYQLGVMVRGICAKVKDSIAARNPVVFATAGEVVLIKTLL